MEGKDIIPDLKERIADTYKKGWQSCTNYRYVQNHPEISSVDLAIELGVSESTIRRSWRKGRTPPAVKAIDELERRGILALTEENKWLPLLNALGIWCCFSGFLSHTYTPWFSEKKEIILGQSESGEKTRDGLENKLKLVCAPERIKTYDQGEGYLVTGDRLLGRLLYVLGVPKGQKTQTLDSLPELCTANSETSGDLVRLLAGLRGYLRQRRPGDGKSLYFSLPYSSAKVRAVKLANSICKTARLCTGIDVKHSAPKKDERGNNYHCEMYVSVKDTRKFLRRLGCKDNNLKGLLHQVLEKTTKDLEGC